MAKEKKIIEVAEYFIKRSEDEKVKDPSRNLTPLKLQKLLYYAKAWNLVFNKGDELFPDKFQAWVHGPANLAVWHYFQDFNFTKEHPEITTKKFKGINKSEQKILDMVWSIYGKFDGKYLEMLTHSEEPWLKARQGLENTSISNNVITDESMISFYERRFKEEKPA